MKEYLEAEINDFKRRRREKYIIFSLLIAISFVTYLGLHVFDLGIDLPFSNTILIFFLININVIMLLLLLFLIVRNLVKLVFERKKNIMGARLRSKLVLAFGILSLVPTVVLFFFSVQFISSSIEYWFNLQVEQSLENSLEASHEYYERITDDILSFGHNISRVVTFEGYMLVNKRDQLEKYVSDKQKEYGLTSIKAISRTYGQRAESTALGADLSYFQNPKDYIIDRIYDDGTDAQYIQSMPHGDLISGIVPVFSRTESKAVVGLLILSKFIPGSFVNRLKAVSRGLQEYRQLKVFKRPIKISNIITLSVVTFIILFSSIWFGFYLSKEITIPIKELAEGTKLIASGDYDFFIDLEAKDELGTLVNSFNRMTSDLKVSKNKLEEANLELIKSNFELDQRRHYMEFILANIAAGVISVDGEGRIITINRSAGQMLHADINNVFGEKFMDILSPEHLEIVRGLLEDEPFVRKGSLSKQIRLPLSGGSLALHVSINVLRDEKGMNIGYVAVIEDLSEIEKMQRMAAWREVARRIAHEVKNPLTPIQLSAQRLKKKYGEILGKDEKGKVFFECTDMIIKQVEELKSLVNEFSNFARMPAVKLAPESINKIIEEAIGIYREAHRDITLVFNESGNIPVFNMDKEQMKRVMINLIDNAIEAVKGEGTININLGFDSVLQMVRIEIADKGAGIDPEHKSRLFEPYFSTKKQGTGLGLAIVNTIITDHNGFIRVQDNKPCGSVFIIELPVRI